MKTWTDDRIKRFLMTEPKGAVDDDAHIVFFDDMEDEEFDKRWEKHGRPQATNQFWKILVDPDMLTGKTVLDAGCGIGRYTSDALMFAAEDVIAVDLSPNAVERTAELCPDALVLQADLLDLPLRDNLFDFAFSIGVVHHTPDPFKAFSEIARTVKPDGLFAVWVYKAPADPAVAAAMELLHAITRLCPREALYNAIKKHAPAVRDIYDKRWEPLQQVVRVSISEDDEECISDTYDWHAPRWRSGHTEAEVHSWFERCGFTVEKVGQHPVNILGRKSS